MNKVSKKFLSLLERDDVKTFIFNLAGEEGYIVFSYLVKRGREIDEFSLSEKVDIQINRLRSILYKLYTKKLVNFSRKRDKKRGWFLYSWSAIPNQLIYLMRKRYEDKIKNLNKLLEGDYYYCDRCDKIYTLEEAAKNMFLCPVCGVHLISSNQMKDEIEKRLEDAKNNLSFFAEKKKKPKKKLKKKKKSSPARIRTRVKRSRTSRS